MHICELYNVCINNFMFPRRISNHAPSTIEFGTQRVRIQKGLAERIGLRAFMNGRSPFRTGAAHAAAGRTKARGVHISSAAVETMSLRYSSVVVSSSSQQPTPTYLRQGRPAWKRPGSGEHRALSLFPEHQINAERERKNVGKCWCVGLLSHMSKLDRLGTSINRSGFYLFSRRFYCGRTRRPRPCLWRRISNVTEAVKDIFSRDEMCSASLNRRSICIKYINCCGRAVRGI